MTISSQIAKHLRDVYSGGNWTVSNFKSTLADVSWQEAIEKVHGFNTIATLVFHTGYFVDVVTKVLEGGPLDAHDKFSFAHPPIQSQADWQQMLDKTFDNAEKFAALVEQLPDSKLTEDFIDKKYGTWYRNLSGIIEHCHYHLGQMVIIKKLLREEVVN
jgi:hypothetical protein